MEEIRIREAVPADLDTLLLFEQELIAAERSMDPTIRPDPVSYYDLPALLADPDVGFMVATADPGIVGCGYARITPARPYLDHSQYAYLGFMYTQPDYRGRGINSSIVTALSAWARSKGLYELRLTVYEDNLPAIRAYEKVGFAKHIQEMRLRLEEA